MRVTSVDDINREMMGYMERHGKTKAGELSELVGISIPSIRYRLFQLMAHGSWVKSGREIVRYGSLLQKKTPRLAGNKTSSGGAEIPTSKYGNNDKCNSGQQTTCFLF